MTIQCCKCHKVKLGSEWTRLPGVVQGAVSHTYCPVCLADTLKEVHAQQGTYANEVVRSVMASI